MKVAGTDGSELGFEDFLNLGTYEPTIAEGINMTKCCHTAG
jgi:hypothetical protein